MPILSNLHIDLYPPELQAIDALNIYCFHENFMTSNDLLFNKEISPRHFKGMLLMLLKIMNLINGLKHWGNNQYSIRILQQFWWLEHALISQHNLMEIKILQPFFWLEHALISQHNLMETILLFPFSLRLNGVS